MKGRGSALLLVITIMSALIMVCVTCWRATTYSNNLAYERGTYEQRAYANRALLDYAIAYAQEQFDSLNLDNSVREYTVNTWPPDKGEYAARIIFKRVDATMLMIHSELLHAKKIVHILECHVCRQLDEQDYIFYSIKNWGTTALG